MTLHLLMAVSAAVVSATLGLAADAAPSKSATTSSASTSPGKPAIEAGPALGWVFPVFSDKEGYRTLTLRGAAARIITADEIAVTGFSAFVFSGDATEEVESVLLSPEATFFPHDNRAGGESTVRLIHDNLEVTGRGWTYDRERKRVSIRHDVHVTFQAQLNDILK